MILSNNTWGLSSLSAPPPQLGSSGVVCAGPDIQHLLLKWNLTGQTTSSLTQLKFIEKMVIHVCVVRFLTDN